MHKQHINESLFADDLKWLVSDRVLIDMHKTKMGTDAEYIVLSIPVNDRKPAIDLAQFIENGNSEYEDVEVSPATDTKGRYLVFVEFERSPDVFEKIRNVLNDASRLSGITDWKFKSLDMTDYLEFNEESFSNNVILTPEDYNQMHPESDDAESEVEMDHAEESIQEAIKQRYRFLMKY